MNNMKNIKNILYGSRNGDTRENISSRIKGTRYIFDITHI